jgi:hypothetical protein
MALIIKALRREGLAISQNPETYIKSEIAMQEISEKVPSNIQVGQWQPVKVDENGKTKSVMRIVEVTIEKEKFISKLESDTAEFKDHVFRVHKQYKQMRTLKENLSEHDMILHMDFAENYICKSIDEIQSAYWNKTGVTLHPVVVYFKREKQHQHKSFVFISDEQSHSSSTVITILTKFFRN